MIQFDEPAHVYMDEVQDQYQGAGTRRRRPDLRDRCTSGRWQAMANTDWKQTLQRVAAVQEIFPRSPRAPSSKSRSNAAPARVARSARAAEGKIGRPASSTSPATRSRRRIRRPGDRRRLEIRAEEQHRWVPTNWAWRRCGGYRGSQADMPWRRREAGAEAVSASIRAHQHTAR